jgi:hypothetical protein
MVGRRESAEETETRVVVSWQMSVGGRQQRQKDEKTRCQVAVSKEGEVSKK